MDEANRASPGPVLAAAQPAPTAALPVPNVAQQDPDEAAQPAPAPAAQPAPAAAAQDDAVAAHAIRALLRSRVSGAAATVLPDQDPLPPPYRVAEQMPCFASCGAGKPCSHRPSETDRAILERNCTAFDVHTQQDAWHCRDCFAPLSLRRVHALPCGHVLCRGCLGAAARAVSTTVRVCKEQIGRWIRLRVAAGAVDEESAAAMYAPGLRPDPEALRRVFDEAHDAAFRVAGATCCGLVFDLRHHIGCLDERTARALVRDMEYLRSSPWDWDGGFCGWADCGSFVPVKYHYVHPVEGIAIMHCVVCKGNSVSTGRGEWSRPCR